MRGHVAWVERHCFGLVFEAPIDPEQVTRDAAAGTQRNFQVMDRYRPETDMRRPAVSPLWRVTS